MNKEGLKNYNIRLNNVDEIEQVIRSTDRCNLVNLFEKKELNLMFVTIFGGKPRSNMKKNDIAYSLWDHFHHVDRAKAFLNII